MKQLELKVLTSDCVADADKMMWQPLPGPRCCCWGYTGSCRRSWILCAGSWCSPRWTSEAPPSQSSRGDWPCEDDTRAYTRARTCAHTRSNKEIDAWYSE